MHVVLYRRLWAQMALSNINSRQLAAALHITYETLRLKLNGEYGFTLKEAFQIKEALHYQGTLEMLFEKQ